MASTSAAAHVNALGLGALSTFACPGLDQLALELGEPAQTTNIKRPCGVGVSHQASASD
jgi:hypothetical protein